MAFCILCILDLHYGLRYFGAPQHNCCFECLEWVNNWCVVLSVYCAVIPQCCFSSWLLTLINSCTHGLEVNKSIIQSFLQQHLYADCESKSHSINFQTLQQLVLLVFKQSKWRASFHFHSSLTEKSQSKQVCSQSLTLSCLWMRN